MKYFSFQILKKAIYGALPKNLKRPNMMERLHLFSQAVSKCFFGILVAVMNLSDPYTTVRGRYLSLSSSVSFFNLHVSKLIIRLSHRDDLIKWVGCPSVRPSIRPFVNNSIFYLSLIMWPMKLKLCRVILDIGAFGLH